MPKDLFTVGFIDKIENLQVPNSDLTSAEKATSETLRKWLVQQSKCSNNIRDWPDPGSVVLAVKDDRVL
jgi:hypothetical protein